jgi:hypothetical protein
MMFKGGKTKLDCMRFSFAGTGSGDEYDPTCIDKDFLSALGLDEGLAERLSIHAKRLEMVQRILKNLAGYHESHTQLLFHHVLGYLVRELEGDDAGVIVADVTGMTVVNVFVYVCKEYLELQGKAHESGLSGKQVALKIKSDIAVGNPPADDDATELFVYGLYNIEMKVAHNVLRGSGIWQKSQLIAESLARSLQIQSDGKEHHNVLFSALCDSCSLHILVHFRKEKIAYLSHREIEPGRMIIILAWLHTMSKSGNLTLEDFKNKVFVAVGGMFEDEVKDSLKKRDLDGGGKKESAKGKHGRSNDGGYGKRKANTTEYEMCLEPHTMDEREDEIQRQQKRDTFSALLNLYHFGQELPLTENVLQTLHGKDTCTFHAANIAWAGLS